MKQNFPQNQRLALLINILVILLFWVCQSTFIGVRFRRNDNAIDRWHYLFLKHICGAGITKIRIPCIGLKIYARYIVHCASKTYKIRHKSYGFWPSVKFAETAVCSFWLGDQKSALAQSLRMANFCATAVCFVDRHPIGRKRVAVLIWNFSC